MSKDESDCGCGSCGCGESESDGERPLFQDDGSFHPMGEEWEAEMEEMLDDTEYDTQLGMDMARDAMRLVKGDITEEEFQEQYHEAVVDEFGTDERPTVQAVEDVDDEDEGGLLQALAGGGDGAVVEKLSSVDPDTDQTRRQTMKKMGAGAAALGLGAMATKENAQGSAPEAATSTVEHADEDTQMGMVIDLDRCDGCLQCVTACIEENNTSTGANWMYVFTYEDHNSGEENFLVRPCQHCTNAPCEKVCPVEARHTRQKDGIVLTNYETCIGCRYCQVACPYGVNYFQWGEPDVPYEELAGSHLDHDELKELSQEERDQLLQEEDDHIHDYRGQWNDSRPPQGTMGKCTFCPTRQDGHAGEDRIGTTACEQACDAAGMSAIHYGDLNDEESRPNQYLEARKEMEPSPKEKAPEDAEENWLNPEFPHGNSQLSAFKLLEELGTDPNVIYLGNEPGPKDEQKEGPVAYEDLGWLDERKERTDQGAAANDDRGQWEGR